MSCSTFTIMKVAADWHELVTPWRIMQLSIARDSGQLDVCYCTTHKPPPQSAALGRHPAGRKLLLINRPRRDGMLSWCGYTEAACEM